MIFGFGKKYVLLRIVKPNIIYIMKKLYLSISFILLGITPVFASGYYGDEVEIALPGIVYFVLFVSALFNIIILIKFWTMCNNVEKLRKNFVPDVSNSDLTLVRARELYMQGKDSEAILYIDECLSQNMYKLYQECRNLYSGPIRVEKFNERWQSIIEKYSDYYSFLGGEIPSRLKNLTYKDYNNFCVAEKK